MHAVWDAGIIEKSVPDWEAEAKMLNDGVTPERAKALTEKLDVVAWANESYSLAVKQVYEGVEAGEKLDQPYVDAKFPLVEEQLTAAGVRLAAVLNKAIAEGESPFLAETPVGVAESASRPR